MWMNVNSGKTNYWYNGPRVLGIFPDSKVHGANMGPVWILSASDGPHYNPMNLAIREALTDLYNMPYVEDSTLISDDTH